MGTILFDFYENGTYGWVATMSLVMAIITACGLLVAYLSVVEGYGTNVSVRSCDRTSTAANPSRTFLNR